MEIILIIDVNMGKILNIVLIKIFIFSKSCLIKIKK